jgi:hypothetical protein
MNTAENHTPAHISFLSWKSLSNKDTVISQWTIYIYTHLEAKLPAGTPYFFRENP